MNNKYLFNDEQIITQSDENIITLTNLRIRYTDYVWGKVNVVSILLEKISSMEIKYCSNPELFVLSVFSIIVGLIAGTTEN